MPNYDYHCEKCDKTFEFFQSMKDDALKVCPKEACCKKPWGKGKVVRQIGTGAGLIFKGSGFYITDYGKDGKKDQRAGGASSSTEGAPKSDGKSDTKSESKPSTSTPSSSSAD